MCCVCVFECVCECLSVRVCACVRMFRLSADQGLKDESPQCRKEEGQSDSGKFNARKNEK